MDVQLRAIEESDLSRIRDWRNDECLRSGFREYRLLNMVNQRDWLDHISRSREVEMFGIDFFGGLVGVCGLCNINWVNRTAEISLFIAPAHQDKGYALQVLGLLRQKAFKELNLHRLWAETYSFHPAQIARLEKSGYVHEGILREHVFKRGRYHDSIIQGLVNDECAGNRHGR